MGRNVAIISIFLLCVIRLLLCPCRRTDRIRATMYDHADFKRHNSTVVQGLYERMAPLDSGRTFLAQGNTTAGINKILKFVNAYGTKELRAVARGMYITN